MAGCELEPKSSFEISRNIYTQDQFDKEFLLDVEPKTFLQILRSKLCKASDKSFRDHLEEFIPSTAWLPKYSLTKNITADIIAGITIAVVSIPQAMAYANLAGLPEVMGLYTSFLPPLIYAFFGNCMHASIGMFGIVSLMVRSVVQKHGIDPDFILNFTAGQNLDELESVQLVTSLTFTVGIITALMALLQFHVIASYLSDSLVNGFTTAAAFHVLMSQIPPIMGLDLPERSGLFKLVYSVIDIVKNIQDVKISVMILSAVCIIILYIAKNYVAPFLKKFCSLPIPFELGIVAVTTLISKFDDFHIKYHMDIVDVVPTGFPKPVAPDFSKFLDLLPDAAVIAVVIYAVTISVGKSFGKSHKYKVNASQELRTLAICQVIPCFFFCQPASVSLSRSQIVAQAGSKSQIANVFAAMLILVVILWAGPLFETLPMAVLSSIIIVALQTLFMQMRESAVLWKISKYDFFVWMFAFFVTIFWDISEGLIASIAFSLITVIIRFQWSSYEKLGPMGHTELYKDVEKYKSELIVPQTLILSMNAPLLFLNADRFQSSIIEAVETHQKFIPANQKPLKYLILDASDIIACDRMGANSLAELSNELLQMGTKFMVAQPRPCLRRMCENTGAYKSLPSKNFYPTVHDAVLSAYEDIYYEEKGQKKEEKEGCVKIQMHL